MLLTTRPKRKEIQTKGKFQNITIHVHSAHLTERYMYISSNLVIQNNQHLRPHNSCNYYCHKNFTTICGNVNNNIFIRQMI